MKFLSSLLAAALTASSFLFSPVSAFTNGTLLPAYMCGPTTAAGAAADGFPKSLGGVLPFFTLATNPFPNTVNGILPNAPLDAGNGGQVNHTMLLLAGFHNRPLSIVPFKQVVHITVIAAATAANPTPVAGQIVPGATHILQIQSTPNDLGVFDDNVALDGTLVYAMDLNLTQRVGTFTAFGDNMQAFPGCGPNNVGAVHNKLLSCVGHYDGLQWTAPASLVPGHVVQFRGAAVTDAGFGAHSSSYPVVAANANTPPTKPTLTQVLLFGTSKAFTFFIDENRGSATVQIASFTVLAQLSATIVTAAQDVPATAAPTVTAPLAIQTTTCKTSPCQTDVAALLKAAGATGGFLALTVTATGKNGVVSAPSNPAIFQVGTITTTTTATTAAPTTATPTTATPTTAIATTAAATKAATTAAATAAATTATATKAATTVTPTTAAATTATPTTVKPTTALATTATPTTAVATTAVPTTAAAAAGLSLAVVATHNTATSCWIIISGTVYDMTNYINNHPGGAGQITNNCGNDATMAYGAVGAHQAAKIPTTTGITTLGAAAVTAAKTVLFVQSYTSPGGDSNANAQVIDQGFMAMCSGGDEAAMQAVNMALAEDSDNACAWQASYAQALVNADAANGAVVAAAVTAGTTVDAAAATTCTTTTTDNTAMIIGVSVGASLLVLGLVAIGAFVYLKKKSTDSNSNQAMTNKMTSV